MRILTLLITLSCLAGLPSQAAGDYGERLKVTPTTDASSEDYAEGDIIRFVTLEPVSLESGRSIPAGSPVYGVVSEVIPRDKEMRQGKLVVQFLYTQATTGEKIKLTGNAANQVEESAARRLMCPSLICFSVKGKPGIIRSGQVFNAIVAE